MNKKMCDNCGNTYDDTLDKCPFCNNVSNNYNVKNMFLNENNNIENNINNDIADKPIVKMENVINNSELINSESNNKNIIFEPKIEQKIEKINNRNTSLKRIKKKKNNNFYSYFLLIISMVLLFIIMLSSFNEFLIIPFSHYVLTAVILIVSFSLSYRNNNVGYFLGMVGAISMIFMVYERDYISAIIGVYIFTSSFRYMIKNK